MSATHIENNIEVTDDSDAFYERTGLLFDYAQLERLGLQMESYAGYFSASRTTELLDFCKKHPSYHIISITHAGRYENCYIPDQRFYYLGDGDKSPNFVLNLFLKKSLELFVEDGFTEAFTIISDIDRSHHGK